MKKILFYVACLTILLLSSCSQESSTLSTENSSGYMSKISSVILDSTWVTTTQVVHYDSKNSGAATGGVVGGTLGWVLVGGPIGIIGGALVGAAVNNHPETVSWVETVKETHCLYTITCENGATFKTTSSTYFVGELQDTRNLVKNHK